MYIIFNLRSEININNYFSAPIERNSHNLVSTIMTSIANISISNPIKSTMTTADKSTRTDDALLSSSTSSLPTEPTSTHTVQTCTTSPPTTTNAATMTTGNNIVATKQITQISVREGRSPSPPILVGCALHIIVLNINF